MRQLFVLLMTLVVILPGPAAGAVYCVADAEQLQAAVTAAEASVADDEIRLRVGAYYETNGSSLMVVNLVGSQSLTISGGWSGPAGGCTLQRIDPTLTRFGLLDVNTRMVVVYYGSGTTGRLAIDNVEFVGSLDTAGETGGCIKITPLAGSGSPTIVLDRLAMRGCHGTFGAAIYAVMQGGELRVRNSLMRVNTAHVRGAVHITAGDATVYVANNTITENESLAGQASGLVLGGDGIFWIGNNVLWGNEEGADLILAPNANLVNNHLGAVAGTTQGVFNGTTSGDPGFAGLFDYVPLPQSPLRNSGNNSVAGGITATDLDGVPRLSETKVDRGAFEFEASMFADGFD